MDQEPEYATASERPRWTHDCRHFALREPLSLLWGTNCSYCGLTFEDAKAMARFEQPKESAAAEDSTDLRKQLDEANARAKALQDRLSVFADPPSAVELRRTPFGNVTATLRWGKGLDAVQMVGKISASEAEKQGFGNQHAEAFAVLRDQLGDKDHRIAELERENAKLALELRRLGK